jgi:Zn-finger nucleic acid-binding protein
MQCVRCDHDLLEMPYHGHNVHVCSGCGGMLVADRSLAPLLSHLERDLLDSIDLSQPVAPIPDEGAVDCPKCGKTCSNYGYMEMRAVFIDRCTSCRVIWLDPEELAVVVMLHGRATRRLTQTFERSRAELRESQRRLGSMMMSQAIMNSGYAAG